MNVAANRKMLNRLMVVRLATLQRIMGRSAGYAFGRETGLNEIDWLIISFVGSHTNPIATQVSQRLMRDKAHVSRALSRLLAQGFITRANLRAPLALTKKGLGVHRRIEAMLEQRNAALLAGVTIDERRTFDRVLDKLFDGANALLANERRLAGARETPPAEVARPAHHEDTKRAPDRADASSKAWLVMPDLHVLLRLLRMSGGLAHGRATGLAQFDWQTLTHVEVNGPLTMADLIESLDRDKSQVGRAVARLLDLDLVVRRREKGVASLVVSTTPAGQEAFDRIMAEARQRDDALIEGLTIKEYRTLLSIMDRLTHNALDLLEQERAKETA